MRERTVLKLLDKFDKGYHITQAYTSVEITEEEFKSLCRDYPELSSLVDKRFKYDYSITELDRIREVDNAIQKGNPESPEFGKTKGHSKQSN